MTAVCIERDLREGRPQLRLIQGGGARAAVRRPAPRAVYRRRRLAVAGVALVLGAFLFVLVQSAVAGTGGGPITTAGARARAIPAANAVYIVQPGDTLWSIAGSLQKGGDIRPLVDRLSQQLGGSTLYPGERIVISSP